MIVECIDDLNWSEWALKYIVEFPVKGGYYTVIKRNHTMIGLGYVLEELNNPKLPDGAEVGFAVKRFKPVDTDITEITKHLENADLQTL